MPKTRYDLLGCFACVLFGLTLTIIGGRLIVYHYVLGTQGLRITGEIIKSGSVRRSSGGYVNFVRYQFRDDSGTLRTGQSSGYSGEIAENILLEYAPKLPFIHRVAGEGKTPGYTWKWAIFGFGILLTAAGIQWFVNTRTRIRLGHRLNLQGVSVKGRVQRITDNGRTITYSYATENEKYIGKTMALPQKIVKRFTVHDPVDVIYDAACPQKSILKIEL